MKQILLRVPDDLHRRLAERARRDGRSMNALAGELLDLGADADRGGRRERLRVRAATEGLSLATTPAPEPFDRALALASTRGWGSVADALLRDERDRG